MIINPVKILIDKIPYRQGMITENIKSRIPINIDNKTVCFALGGGLGDLFFLTPLLKYAKENSKDLKIVCAFSKAYLDVFIGHPYIDHLMTYGKHNDPDVSINFDYTFDFGHAITLHEAAESLTGVQAYFKWIDNEFDLSKLSLEDQRPVVSINMISQEAVYKFIEENNLNNGKINVALQLRSSSLLRNWLPEYNRELADKLVSYSNCNILLFDDNPLQRFSGDNIYWTNTYLKTMSQVIALLSFCDVIVCPDSSFAQIAQGLRKPYVGIYGAFPKKLRTLDDDLNFSIELDPKLSCQPCYLHKQMCPIKIPSPCMKEITSNMVLDKALKAIEHSKKLQAFNKFTSVSYEDISSQVVCPYCNSSTFGNLLEYCNDVIHVKSRGLRDYLKDAGSNYKVCFGCKSIYYAGDISNKKTLSMYKDDNYHDKHSDDDNVYLRDMKIQAEQTLKILNDHYRQIDNIESLHIADFGSGIGAFDRFLIDLDPDTIRIDAFDISTNAAHIAKRKFNINVSCFDIIQDVFPNKNFYNVVILSHVIEHLNGHEIERVLNKVRVVLHENGVLYIRGPLANRFYEFQKDCKDDDIWIHLKPEGGFAQHMSLSTLKGLEKLLERIQFKIIYMERTEVFADDFHLLAKPIKKKVDPSQHGVQTMTRLSKGN